MDKADVESQEAERNIPESIVEMRLLEAREKAEERYSNSYEINVYMREQFYSFVQIYTDGSKDPIEQKVGIGVYIPRFKTEISLRLSDKLSVYSTELTAIIIGLQWVEQIKPNRIVICSDSSSALKSIILNENEIKSVINRKIIRIWQQRWENSSKGK